MGSFSQHILLPNVTNSANVESRPGWGYSAMEVSTWPWVSVSGTGTIHSVCFSSLNLPKSALHSSLGQALGVKAGHLHLESPQVASVFASLEGFNSGTRNSFPSNP